MSVADVLAHAPADPSALALVDESRAWTYGELATEVDARADALWATGARAGSVEPVVLDLSRDGIVTLLALWRLGATAAPLNPRLTGPERDAARAALRDERADAQAVLWTSGTAGRPRGVVISFEALAASARAAAERLALGGSDVWLASLSPAHIGGLVLVVRSLLLGGTLVATGPFDAGKAADLLEGRGLARPGVRLTHLSVVPTQLLRLLDARPGPPPSSLRCVLVGGAHAPGELVSRALATGWPVALTYGLTQATSQVATAPPELTRRKPGTVGPPVAGVEVRIAPDGEILVRGPTVAARYVGGGGEAVVDEAGWHHTGDIGRLDSDGDLWVTGRRAERIVSGGVTVDAVEVEEALRAHADVADACVVGLPDLEWGERVAAWIVPAVGRHPDPERIDAFLRERLTGPKRPRVYHVGDELPRNANGKVDRRAVLAAIASREPRRGG